MREAYIELIKKSVTGYLCMGGDRGFESYWPARLYNMNQSRWDVESDSRPRTLLSRNQLDLVEEIILELELDGVEGDLSLIHI